MKTTTAPNWIKSEDAGYSAGRLLLDLPRGDLATIDKVLSGGWVCAVIRDGVCVRSAAKTTKRDAKAWAESQA